MVRWLIRSIPFFSKARFNSLSDCVIFYMILDDKLNLFVSGRCHRVLVLSPIVIFLFGMRRDRLVKIRTTNFRPFHFLNLFQWSFLFLCFRVLHCFDLRYRDGCTLILAFFDWEYQKILAHCSWFSVKIALLSQLSKLSLHT